MSVWLATYWNLSQLGVRCFSSRFSFVTHVFPFLKLYSFLSSDCICFTDSSQKAYYGNLLSLRISSMVRVLIEKPSSHFHLYTYTYAFGLQWLSLVPKIRNLQDYKILNYFFSLILILGWWMRNYCIIGRWLLEKILTKIKY